MFDDEFATGEFDGSITTKELIKLEEEASNSTVRTLQFKAHKTLDRIELALEELGIRPPTSTGSDLWEAILQVGTETLGAWSLGRWHRDPVRHNEPL